MSEQKSLLGEAVKEPIEPMTNSLSDALATICLLSASDRDPGGISKTANLSMDLRPEARSVFKRGADPQVGYGAGVTGDLSARILKLSQ